MNAQAEFAIEMGLKSLGILPAYSFMYVEWIGKILKFQFFQVPREKLTQARDKEPVRSFNDLGI